MINQLENDMGSFGCFLSSRKRLYIPSTMLYERQILFKHCAFSNMLQYDWLVFAGY